VAVNTTFKLVQEQDRHSCFLVTEGFEVDKDYVEKWGM
jgi:hypothetical protein